MIRFFSIYDAKIFEVDLFVVGGDRVRKTERDRDNVSIMTDDLF